MIVRLNRQKEKQDQIHLPGLRVECLGETGRQFYLRQCEVALEAKEGD